MLQDSHTREAIPPRGTASCCENLILHRTFQFFKGITRKYRFNLRTLKNIDFQIRYALARGPPNSRPFSIMYSFLNFPLLLCNFKGTARVVSSLSINFLDDLHRNPLIHNPVGKLQTINNFVRFALSCNFLQIFGTPFESQFQARSRPFSNLR